MAVKITQRSTGKTWTSGTKETEQEQPKQEQVEAVQSMPSGTAEEPKRQWSSKSGKTVITQVKWIDEQPAKSANSQAGASNASAGTDLSAETQSNTKENGFFQRAWNTIKGGFNQFLSAAEDTMGTRYQAGQTARDDMNTNMANWAREQYEGEVRTLESMRSENVDVPGTYSDAAIANQQRIVDEAAQRAGIYEKVSGIQQEAGEAARDLALERYVKSQQNIEDASEGLGKAGQTAVQIGAGLTGIGISLAADAATGGKSTIPGVLLRMVNKYGSSTMAARAGGKDLAAQQMAGAISASGVAVGSALSSGFDPIGQNVLGKMGLLQSTGAVAVKDGVRAMAYALGDTGMNELSKALTYPDSYKPDAGEIATDLFVAFAFGAASSLLQSAKVSSQNKQQMRSGLERLDTKYQAAKMKMAGMTGAERAKAAQECLDEIYRFTGDFSKMQITGADAEVRNVYAALQIMQQEMESIVGSNSGIGIGTGTADIPISGGLPTVIDSPAPPNTMQPQTASTNVVESAAAAQAVSQELQARGLDAATADALVRAATEMQQEASPAPSGGQNAVPTETVAQKQNTAQMPEQDTAQAETLASTGSEASTPKQEPPKTAKKAAAPAKTRTTEAASMEPIAKTLGASGQKAIFNAYDGKMDTAEYAGEFVKVYNAARAGNDLPETKTLEPWQKYAAEVAGKNDMEPQTAQEVAAVKPEQTGGQATEETPFKPGLDYSDYVKAAVRDGEMTTETAQQIDTVAKQLGVRVRFADEVAGGTANAELSGNEVLIEKHNSNPVMFLLGHELTHRIQETAPEQYQQFREAIMDEIRPQAQAVMENYAQRGYEITEEAALDEVAADYAGRMIDDGEVLDDFIEKHRDDRTLLQKIIDAIRSFIRKLTGAERKKAKTAEGKLLAAMDAAAEKTKNAASEGSTQFSIKKTDDGKKYVVVDRQQGRFIGLNNKEAAKLAKEIIQEEFSGQTLPLSEYSAVTVRRRGGESGFDGAKKYAYDGNRYSDDVFQAKMRAAANLDEMLESAEYVGHSDDHKNHTFATDGFDYYKTTFVVGGRAFEGVFNVGLSDMGATFYGMTKIEQVTDTNSFVSSLVNETRSDNGDLRNSRVARNDENVNGKLSVKGAEMSREYADVLKENELLKERVDYWKGQTRRTVRATTNEKSVSRETNNLVNRYGADLDAADIQGDLQSLYDAMANGELDGKEAFTQAKEIAGKLVENAVEANDELYQSYKDLRNFMRTTKLTISEEDGKNIPDLTELRKQNFGRMTIGKGQTNIDQVYQELADQWPEFFDEDAVLHPADQLQQISDVLGRIYTITEQNPYQGYMEQAKTAAANEILDDFFELPQTRKTFADRQAAMLSETKAKGKAQAQKIREQKNAQLADLREKNRARVNSILEKERTRRADQINKLKEQYKSRDAATKDRRETRELRNKIIRHTKGLSQKLIRPTDKQHIPEILKYEVAAMLESINMESQYTIDESGKRVKDGSGTPTKRSEAFEALKAKYTQIVKDGDAMTVDPYLLGNTAEGIEGGFDEVIKMKDTPLADLSKSQLQTVWNVVRAVEHSVSTYGKMLSSAKYTQTKTWAEAIRNDVSERRPIRKRTTRLTLDLETPYTFFSHYGDSGKAIYRMLRDAQDQQQLIVDRITEETQKIVDPKTVKQLEKQTHTFQTASGKTLTLTTAQAMEIYNLMQRKQALEHLTNGGIIQPEIKSAKIGRGFEAIRLTEADLQQIAGSLTAEQVKIADGLQGLTTGLLADYGNDASMRAYGYKKFTEKGYWPIRSAREGVQSTVEKGGNQPRSIQNVGLAKPLTPGANNPLDVPGIFTTFANHAAEMTDYAAWLCTMEDANHLFNYQFRDENGLPTGRNIRQILDEYGGRGAQSYWRSLMDNIQNGINLKEFGPMTDFAGKAISGFKGAAVGGNIRVVIQQPTAFFRAAAVLDPADMAKGLVKGVKGQGGWSRALEYSPIAMRKYNGGFDISAPYTMKETLFDTRTAIRKLNDTLSAPAGAADAVTWGRLWNACEWAVHRENPYLEPGSKAFYEQTAKQFAEVIDQTQVVDGVLQRSNIMRNKGEIAKQATSFMGEPIMSLNLLVRSWDNIRYEQEPRKRSKAIKTFGRAVMALVVTAAVNAMAQSLIDAIRDDDPDKDYKERYLSAFTGISGDEETTWQKAWNAVMEGNLGGNLNYVGNIPYVKDFLSMLQGYEVNRMDTEVVGDLVDAGKMFAQNVDGKGTKTSAYAVKSLLGAASKVYGVPVNNLTRDMWGMVRSVAVETKNIPLQYKMEKAIYNITNNKNKSRYISILYRALEQGDIDSFQHIRSDLMNTMGLDGAEIDESLRSRYNKAVKKDPAYTLPQATRDLIGSRDKYKEETTDEKFSAKDLNETQYRAYSDQRAADYREIEDALKDSDTYQSLDAKTRSKLIEAAYDLVEQRSLEDHSDGQYEITTKWMTLADDAEKIGIEPYMYVTFHVVYNTTESTKGADGKAVKGQSKSDKIRKWLKDNRDLTEQQRKFLWEAVYESDW